MHGGATPDDGEPDSAPRDLAADARGLLLLAAIVFGPTVLHVVWSPLRPVAWLVLLVSLPILLWTRGPRLAIDRRAAVLVGIPLFGLFAVAAAVWRWTHRARPYWPDRLEPPWGRVAWGVIGTFGIAGWIALAGGTLRALGRA